ncbi:MAG: nitrogen fixation protein NifZ [Pseudomonadota bacterium]
MKTRFDFGDVVRVIRNVKDDGTYPGAAIGQLLVRRGNVGHVVDIGGFLQDQVIYAVHFLDINRIIGCRGEELIGADEDWVPSRYEFREKVRAALPLGKQGQVLVPSNAIGEIVKVVRNAEGGVAYQVHFECLLGRVLLVPETALLPLAPQAGPEVLVAY